jgi:hypothetical protein
MVVKRLVVHGATLRCDQGAALGTLNIVPAGTASANTAAATVMDHVPMKNLAPFGACRSPTNPQVAAATAAAMGVLTPQPCVPVVPAPWSAEAAAVKVGGAPALVEGAQCACAWGGTITIASPGGEGVGAG